MSNLNKSTVISIKKMWAHPVFLIGAGVVALITAAAAAYTHYRNQQLHDLYRYEEPRIPDFDRRVLGPCGICKGDASVIDSWLAPCHHHLHYTCTAGITRSSNSCTPIDWSQQNCMACLEQRITRIREDQRYTGLRNRTSNVRRCANCLTQFVNGEEDIKTMECEHLVHKACWERMQNSGSSTCPTCIMEM